MYQAEHLDLITNVRDNFTDDLTRLSGLLETVGRQADVLSPIRIRVNVFDRELDQLQARMASLQTQAFIQAGGKAPNLPMTHQGSHTPADSPTEILRDAVGELRGMNNTLSERGTYSGSRLQEIATLALLNQLQKGGGVSGTTGGTDGVSDAVDLTAFTPTELQEMTGVPVGTMARGQRLSPAALARGESPFTMAAEHLEESLSPEAISRAMDTGILRDAVQEDVMTDMLGDDVTELATGTQFLEQLAHLDMAQLTKVFGGRDNLIDAMGESIDDTTAQVEQLKESFFDIRIGMTQFYDFLAAAVPLMFVFIGSVPAIVGALGGLGAAALGAAGALASIAGLGLLGRAATEAGGQRPGFDEITDVLEDLPDEFFDAFRPLAQRLEPVFGDALDNADAFFEEIAAGASAVTRLEDDARAFAAFMTPFLAGTLHELFVLADEARPIFSEIAAGLENRDIIRGFSGALADVLPQVSHLVTLFLDALPALAAFSRGMLTLFTNMMSLYTSVYSLITGFMELIPFIDDADALLGVLVGSLFLFMSATFLATKIAAIFRASLFDVTNAIVSNKVAADTLTGTLVNLKGALLGTAQSGKAAAFSIHSVRGALKALLATTGVGILLFGIGTAVTGLANEFDLLSDNAKEATDAMKELERQERRMGSRGYAYLGDLDGNVHVSVVNETNIDVQGNMDDRDARTLSFRTKNKDPTAYV